MADQRERVQISFEEVLAMLQKQAEGYIAGRACKYSVSNEGPRRGVMMHLETAEVQEKRPVIYWEGLSMYECLDTSMASLTHMAVNCGLIETTPKDMTHQVSIVGQDWQTTEVQLDGHTLRGVFSADISFEAGEKPTVKLGFSRSKVHLDQAFLPRDMQIEIEGMDRVLGVLREVTQRREDGFKDELTGGSFAALHSGEEEVEFYREVYDTLHLYEAVMEDPEVMTKAEGEASH